MKWLLINPRPEGFRVLGKYEKMMVPFAPMGLAYIGAVLEKEGAKVAIYDGFAEPGVSVLDRIQDKQPDAVGISCLTPTVNSLKILIPAIRKIVPHTKVVLGNIHPSLYHRQMLEEGLADCIVRGEAEDTVRELNSYFSGDCSPENIFGLSYKINNKVYVNPERETLPELDTIPFPAWHLLDLDRYLTPPMFAFRKRLLPVLASRGCPFRCYFCAQNVMNPIVRKRNLVHVVDEIEAVHELTGVDMFWFCDAIFPLSRKDAEIFCREMIARGLQKKISWITETRVDLVDRALIRRMKEAGLFMILYGLESGDEHILASVKPGVDLESGRRAVEAARCEGVLTLGLFILGLPGESTETIRRTIRFAREIGLDFAKFNRAVPYPGSKFFTDVYSENDLPDFDKFSSLYEPGQNDDIVYSPVGMSNRELITLQKRAFFSFYVRPRVIMRHIFRGTIAPSNMLRGGMLIIKNYVEELKSQA